MTLTELRYVVALAQTKHFGKAAKTCFVSQPTLSVAINKLETKLGTPIFERHHNDIRITDIGKKIVVQAQKVLDEVSLIETIAQESKCELNSPIKIGGIFTVAPYLFPLFIPKLKKIAPHMPLIVQEDFTANLRQKLQEGKLDAILIALPFNEPGVVTKILYEESFVILMRKDHPLAKNDLISHAELKKEMVLLLGEGHCLSSQILEACPYLEKTKADQNLVEGTSLETLRHMVASGFGITILPSSAAKISHYQSSLCIKSFKTKIPKRKIALAWRSSYPKQKAIDVILKAIDKSY